MPPKHVLMTSSHSGNPSNSTAATTSCQSHAKNKEDEKNFEVTNLHSFCCLQNERGLHRMQTELLSFLLSQSSHSVVVQPLQVTSQETEKREKRKGGFLNKGGGTLKMESRASNPRLSRKECFNGADR
jgi:hypothetical protein